MPAAGVFLLAVGAVAVAAFARHRHWNAPLIVLATALVASFIPGMPQFEVEPEILLGVVLPPLLYSAALSSSYQDFRASIKPICQLGVGLVLVTALAVAGVATWLLPGLGFFGALVLGAVVAPPDAVAAAAVARKLGLPRRITTLLTGESLINDATSLTLYSVALTGVFTTGQTIADAVRVFVVAVVVGVGVGIAMGFAVHFTRRILSDPVVETVLGLALPFACYWIAEEIHGSGVLAVVAAGFLIGHYSPRESYATRLQEEPLWASIDLILESFTFALIGMQLQWIIHDIIVARDHTQLAFITAGCVLLVTLGVRPIYIFTSRWLGNLFRSRRSTKTPPPTSRADLTVVSWAGMRGVVTLAAAAAIPITHASTGMVFPQRATVQLCAYLVAIGTLLLQGPTLPWLIRKVGIGREDEAAEDAIEEARVRVLASEAAARVIHETAEEWSKEMGIEHAQAAADRVAEAVARRGQAAAYLIAGNDDSDLDLTDEGDEQPIDVEAAQNAVVGPAAGTAAATTVAALPEGEDAEGATEPPGTGVTHSDPYGLWARPLGAKPGPLPRPEHSKRVNQLRQKLVKVQREVVVAERDAGRLNETVMRIMLRELDLEQESLSMSWANRL